MNDYVNDEQMPLTDPNNIFNSIFSIFFIHAWTIYWIIFRGKKLEYFYISIQKEQLTQYEHI